MYIIKHLFLMVALLQPVIDNPTYIELESTKTQKSVPSKFDVPNVSIGGYNGPVDIGEMIILSADYDALKIPDGMVNIQFNWTVLDKGQQKRVFTADGGRQIAFAVGMKPRKITVILDVNCLFEKKATVDVVDLATKVVTKRTVITEAQALSPAPLTLEIVVGEPGPEPVPPNPGPQPPNPNPVPVPEPSLPDGQYGLAKFMYQLFMSDTTLESQFKIALAKELANNLESIASKIVAVSDYKDMAVILADTKKGNNDAFGKIPGLDLNKTVNIRVGISNKIAGLYKDKKLNNAADISVAWNEMSLGLRQIK